MRSTYLRRPSPGLPRRLVETVRGYRIRRFERYIAQIATVSDPAAEYYYRKIFSESVTALRDFRKSLATLIGQSHADSLMLWESRRIRTPGRVLFSAAGALVLLVGDSLATTGGLLGFLAGAVVFATGRSASTRRSYRLVEVSRRRGLGDDPWESLHLVHRRTWDRLLRRRLNELPAKVLGPGPRRQQILDHLGIDDPEVIETIVVLGEDFDGSVGDLVDAARLLNN